MVPNSEAQRSRRFRSPEHGVAALQAAAFLRAVLARTTDVDPLALRFSSTCRWCGHPTHGKPRLVWPRRDEAFSFSLSHTAGLAALAVGYAEVGIDVERLATPGGLVQSQVVLTIEEQARLAHEPEQAAGEAFLRLWTQKEAYLKGIGMGIVQDPARVCFTSRTPGWSQVIHDEAPTSWHVQPLRLDGPWVGALAVDRQPGAVILRIWSLHDQRPG
jgi:phosphopantetheinyl transferase